MAIWGKQIPGALHLPRLELCMDPQLQWMSQSIIYPVGKLSGGECEIKSFYTNNNHQKNQDSKMLCHVQRGPIPGLLRGLKLITGRGENYTSAQGWWMTSLICVQGLKVNGDRGIYLENGGWGQARLGALRHKTLTNLSSGPHCLGLFFVLNPCHSLSDPHRSCCQCVKNALPCRASYLCWCL